MRELTSFSDPLEAEKLAAYLLYHEVESQVEQEEHSWTVWVINDDQRGRALELQLELQASPESEAVQLAQQHAAKQQQQQEKARAQARRRAVSAARLRQRWKGHWYRCFPATVVLIGISLAVVLLTTDFHQGRNAVGLTSGLCNRKGSVLLEALFLDVRVTEAEVLEMIRTGGPPSPLLLTRVVTSGEVWRLVTPIFLHFSFLHIFFNMYWMWGLGRGVEFLRGTPRFLAIVLLIAVVSNISQWLVSGPAFGGMSGVVFGLIGYAWMKGRYEPHEGLGLRSEQITYSLFFLFLGFGGAFGSVANTCHLAGLLTGMLIGARKHIIRTMTR